MVCAGRGIVTVYALASGAAPKEVGRLDTGHTGIHTASIDESNGDVWVVWGDAKGDWVQRLKFTA